MAKKCISIVIVDDNDMMRSILRSMLRGDVFEVIGEARNGVLAVEMAGRLKPDIVCLDVITVSYTHLQLPTSDQV